MSHDSEALFTRFFNTSEFGLLKKKSDSCCVICILSGGKSACDRKQEIVSDIKKYTESWMEKGDMQERLTEPREYVKATTI